MSLCHKELPLAIQLVGITQMPQWPEEKGSKEVNQPPIIINNPSSSISRRKKGGKEAR